MLALRAKKLADCEVVSCGGPMAPLVERDREERLVTVLLELMDADDGLAARREARESESARAGKARAELDADEVRVTDRDEESLTLRWPRRASPSRGCEDAVRPREGILEAVEGLGSDVLPASEPMLEVVEPVEAARLGSKSTSNDAPD